MKRKVPKCYNCCNPLFHSSRRNGRACLPSITQVADWDYLTRHAQLLAPTLHQKDVVSVPVLSARVRFLELLEDP